MAQGIEIEEDSNLTKSRKKLKTGSKKREVSFVNFNFSNA